MPTIDTLAQDIAALWDKEQPLSDELIAQLGVAIAMKTKSAFEREPRDRTAAKVLYASEIGKPCIRQIWYGYYHPELAEPLPASAKTKFLYGDILEEYVLMLAKAAGHTVEDEQKPVEVPLTRGWKIRGRMDARIDGVIVDVKSCSSYSYKKFKEGLNDNNDSFGYRQQLSVYTALEPAATPQGFLAIDKQNGHVGYFPADYVPVGDKAETIIDVLEDGPHSGPKRAFIPVPDGKSGNEKLCVECSYCAFKQHCWNDANGGEGLKAYAYSYGPVFLTTTKRTPNVPQITLEQATNPIV